jgi:3-methylcrotonyl-CoA carboxylase beta subunit
VLSVATPAGARALFASEELYGIVPKDTRRPFDIREVIARIVDGSEFQEFKARYGKTLVCGFAHCTDIRSASSPTTASCFRERAQGRAFHRTVRAARHPAGVPAEHHRLHGRRKYENAGIAKDGAKMVTAVACASGAQVHRRHRRQLRRGQLRDVRARVWRSLPVDVANR